MNAKRWADYMRKWRARNREKSRTYIREYMRRRRGTIATRFKDPTPARSEQRELL